MAAATALISLDHRRHRRAGLDRRAALLAAIADAVPASVRKLTAHEFFLSTSFLHRVTRRGRTAYATATCLSPTPRVRRRSCTASSYGVADMAVAGQTTVTVELTEPVRYIRALGKPAEARAFRFYADDPASAVAMLKASGPSAGTNRTGDTLGPDSVSRTRSR
ncbi:hypothetical protein ABZV67_38915 [Streptomyces sp. NPDC005065]|uniref:hypothetical protein n=1 Tax=Streptomyces sp. NPDC005065 TaxID=3154461 RepID=UPI0033AE5E3F